MKLTVRDVAKMTGLSISTVRQYSWRMKVGKKEGTTKYFTHDEAKAIGSGNHKRGPKKGSKRVKQDAAPKRTAKSSKKATGKSKKSALRKKRA
jgi:hypothetical protein